MRKLIAAAMVAGAAAIAAPALAADLPYYPPVIDIPDVDYGYEGSFYLRGSVAGNWLWARDYTPGCPTTCVGTDNELTFTEAGFGYSFGAGVGYETGTGFRADVTLDHLRNKGLTDDTYELELRSTILLANAYYDFPISGGGAAGGFGAYVGAGIGGAYNQTSITGGVPTPDGESWAPTAAVMAGVTYDMGSIVADLGYRGLYTPEITNAQRGPSTSYYINDPLIHEVRGSLRYRFN